VLLKRVGLFNFAFAQWFRAEAHHNWPGGVIWTIQSLHVLVVIFINQPLCENRLVLYLVFGGLLVKLAVDRDFG
jgi:hypothetical protein